MFFEPRVRHSQRIWSAVLIKRHGCVQSSWYFKFGIPFWIPSLDSNFGLQIWNLHVDSKLGVHTWIPNIDADFVFVDGPSHLLAGHNLKNVVDSNALHFVTDTIRPVIIVSARRATVEFFNKNIKGYRLIKSDLLMRRFKKNYNYFSIFEPLSEQETHTRKWKSLTFLTRPYPRKLRIVCMLYSCRLRWQTSAELFNCSPGHHSRVPGS